MRRREECIGKLKALGDCEGAAKTVRFMEAMQLDDMHKCNRSLLLMNEMEDKAREKSRRNLLDELRSIRGIVVVEKAAKFVADSVRKDNAQVAQLREVESQMEFMALEKEKMLKKSLNHRCMSLLRELAGAADSTDIRDQLPVLMRDAYIEEFQRLQMYDNSDEVIESIEILKGMQVDDMEKTSRLILLAREVQNRVYEKNNFITKLRR
ncbi:hypothetical protein Tco_0238635 [Tanacetum coccineum]